MNKSIYENNLFLASEWDQKFHSYIITFSGNKRLLSLYETLNNQSKRFQASTLNDKDLAQQSYEEHKELFNDIREKNIDKAREAVKLHYHNIKQYYITKLLNR
jgi:DNA-binding GntR family transcriptional regulator